MSAPKHEDILTAVKDRSKWEDRQGIWYQMRHDGLRRKNKPWANAADMHYPLADMLIEKLKPYYIGQIFATDTVASFVGLSAEYQQAQAGAGQWFDFQLKQKSNFEAEMCIVPDIMLEKAKCPVKAFWDARSKQLKFEAINPIYLIVPPWTGKLVDADWIVHVQHYSRTAFKGLQGFKNDAATIERLVGGDGDSTSTASYELTKCQREGITHTRDKEQIVVWEVFYRNEQGRWWVKTYSPAVPTVALRDDFGLPYNRGVFADELPPPPFAEFNAEAKGRGYYDARGVCERVAPFEASLCKDWNTMKDYQTLTCAPVFSAEGNIQSNANMRMVPGQILPFKLTAVQFPPIPVDLPAGMLGTRQTAEQLLAVPDVGTGRAVDPSKNKTAAETNLVASIMGQSQDTRARMFRGELGHLLNLAWAIAVQYERENVDYYFMDELLQLDPKVLDGKYRIEPNGSGDNVNRGLVLQRAVARLQMFKGDPDIEQKELKRSVLEADDPRMAKKLLLNEGTQQAAQQEDQAQEITILLEGFAPEVRPTDDDTSHFTSVFGFVERRNKLGPPLTAEQFALLATHCEQHMQSLKKKNPPQFQQQGQKMQQFVMELKQAAQALAQQQAQAPAMVPMNGGAAA